MTHTSEKPDSFLNPTANADKNSDICNKIASETKGLERKLIENNLHYLTRLPRWMRRGPEFMRAKQHVALTSINHLSWTLPEITYWGFSSYEIIFPLILERYCIINIPKPGAIDFSWNMLDSFASIGIGLTQIFDRKTHRPWVQRTKGSINLVSGIQLMIFTAMVSPAAPIAFLVASLVDLILSLEPLVHTYLCWTSFGYWLKDSLAQLNKLHQDIQDLSQEQQQFDNRHQTLRQSNHIILNKKEQAMMADLKWIADQKQERLEKLIDEAQTIGTQIIMRLAYRKDNLNESIPHQIQENVTLNALLARTELAVKKNSSEHQNVTIPLPPKDLITKHERILDKKLRGAFKDAAQETIVFVLALLGWTLLLVPGLQLPAIIFISLTAAHYLIKHSHELVTRKTNEVAFCP